MYVSAIADSVNYRGQFDQAIDTLSASTPHFFSTLAILAFSIFYPQEIESTEKVQKKETLKIFKPHCFGSEQKGDSDTGNVLSQQRHQRFYYHIYIYVCVCVSLKSRFEIPTIGDVENTVWYFI